MVVVVDLCHRVEGRTDLCLRQVHLLDAVVVAVDVVVLRCKHANDGVLVEVLDGSSVQIIHLLDIKYTHTHKVLKPPNAMQRVQETLGRYQSRSLAY
jgi:hypothetical protein